MLRRRYLFVPVLGALMFHCTAADELPRAQPEYLGFSSERLAHIDTIYSDKVAAGEMAGIVILIARHGQLAHLSAIGYSDLGVKRRMEKNTIFRLYSMTKPIAATALMMLYEEGKFQLYDPVSKYIPECANLRVLRTPNSALTDTVPAIREPTIHDLFRHTSGLTHGGNPQNSSIDAAYIQANLFGLDTSLADMIARLCKIPLHYQPGTKFEYSISQDVQARLVEILSGMPFQQFLQTRLFEPLGMKDSGYWVEDPSRLSAVHWSREGQLVPCDDAHGCPKPTWFLLEATNINSYTKDNAHKGGSYGLVGSAGDYWRFAQTMLNGGALEGRRILSKNTVNYITQNHLGSVAMPDMMGRSGSGWGWGLGFAVLTDPVAAEVIGSEGSFYWAGAANTMFWIDPTEDIVVVALTQHMETPTVGDLYSQLRSMVYGALTH